MLSPENRIQTKQQLKEWLALECSGYKTVPFGCLLYCSEESILRKFHILLRKTEYYTNTGKKIRAKWYSVRLLRWQIKTGIHIPINSCKKGLRLMHVGPILVNSKATVGENCALHINTGIVAGGRDNRAPTLGNDVVVGIGAVILGGVTIADGVAIGANAVVNKDVPEPDIAVAGVPAKKISDNGRRTWNRKETDQNKISQEKI